MTNNSYNAATTPSNNLGNQAATSGLGRRRPEARCRLFTTTEGTAIAVWDVVTQPFAEDKLPSAKQLVTLMDESRTSLHQKVTDYVMQHNLPVPMIWNDRF